MDKIYIFIGMVLFTSVCFSQAPYPQDSPYDPSNNPYSYDNNPYNSTNNPYNSENNPYKSGGNSRVIRDNEGNATGYAVPRPDGGVNFFDYKTGNRTGYQPAPRK
ncbi:MAG: hypothetical protein RL610_1468 [Pseudomonadota bacterium]